ncbi:MAG: glycosyltransferase [Muribaculum sp.]|nr:glycosyltransferase [Muribaculum sp.]
MADYISGESKKYAEVAHDINQIAPYSHTYIGVDTGKINSLIEGSDVKLDKPDEEVWIGYGGSLGQSYDFDVILDGLRYLKEKKVKYKMWFIGDGEKASYIQNAADQKGLDIVITGRLDYRDLLKYLSYCDIAINTFKEGTLVVHSYKFNDYVAAGCYVLNNLPGETADMIVKYDIGQNFNRSNFKEKLLETVLQWNSIKPRIHQNLQKLISEELNQVVIYKKLREDILNRIGL